MLGKGLCKVWLVMDYLLCSASVFNIVLISYDRFLSVTRAVSTGFGGAHYHTHPDTQLTCYHSLIYNVQFALQREVIDINSFIPLKQCLAVIWSSQSEHSLVNLVSK